MVEREQDDVREALVGRLRDFGVKYLTPSDAEAGRLGGLPPRDVIARLVVHPDPRLRHAVIALLLLHPDWAADVSALVEPLNEPARTEWQCLYMAAVYLQRLWWTRLTFYLDRFEALPDLYSETLGLPPADERYGKSGLYALAAWQAERSPYPFNYLASYNKTVKLLFAQLKLEARQREPAAAG